VEIFDEPFAGLEADGMHAGFAGAGDKFFHIVDKDGFFGPKTDLLQNTAVDPEVWLARPHFVGREPFFEMTQNPEMLFDIGKMKVVGVRNKIERITLLDPFEESIHSGILPKDIIPVMLEGLIGDGVFENTGSRPVKFQSGDLAAGIGLFESGKKEMRPDPYLGDPAGFGETARGALDIIIDKHIAEIEDDGFDIMDFFHKTSILAHPKFSSNPLAKLARDEPQVGPHHIPQNPQKQAHRRKRGFVGCCNDRRRGRAADIRLARGRDKAKRNASHAGHRQKKNCVDKH